ncbi:hypothetical protein K438DRAFT_1776617 [Mycena galopus ATCC 62051]|nr:hypothetical protein K438DRAFT_1776617 [Mycena galopus ATCC 62051]
MVESLETNDTAAYAANYSNESHKDAIPVKWADTRPTSQTTRLEVCQTNLCEKIRERVPSITPGAKYDTLGFRVLQQCCRNGRNPPTPSWTNDVEERAESIHKPANKFGTPLRRLSVGPQKAAEQPGQGAVDHPHTCGCCGAGVFKRNYEQAEVQTSTVKVMATNIRGGGLGRNSDEQKVCKENKEGLPASAPGTHCSEGIRRLGFLVPTSAAALSQLLAHLKA